MSKQFMPIERVLELFGNRYVALNLASQEVRHIIERINRGQSEITGSPYYESLRRLIDGEIKFELVAKKEESTEKPE